MTIEQTALSLYQLLGAPLYALIQAETYAANATAEFIEKVGFEAPEESEVEGDLGKLRTLTFKQERRGPDGQAASYKVEVPLLSMLPIPALQIQEAELEFFVKIIDTATQSRATRTGRSAQVKTTEEKPPPGSRYVPMPGYLDMKAMLGRGQPNDPRTPNTAFDMQVHIKIKVAQADPPAGLSRMFNLLEQGVSSSKLPEK
jgi:hypothetical protein